MKLFAFLLRRARGALVVAVLAGLASGVSNTGLLALINGALAGSLGRSTLIWSFVGLCLLVPAARIVSELLLTRVGQDTILHLRLHLSRQLLAAPLRRQEELGRERILAALTDDVPTITNAVATIPLLCINLAVAVTALAYLAWLSWQTLAIVVCFMALGIVTYQLPIVRALGYMRRARDRNEALYVHFRAITDGAKELKLHGRRREAFMVEELGATALELRNQTLMGQRILTVASSWGQLLLFVVIGLLLVKWTALGSSVLIGYSLVLLYLMTPLQTLLNAAPILGRARVSLERVEAMGVMLQASATDETPAAEAASGAPWKRIDLVGITHTYRRDGQDGNFVLGPIDLVLEPAELVLIAGGNGSGKTTLIKLLTGLYVPDAGEILWDAKVVDDHNRDAFRQNFSAVFSDFYLFTRLLGLEGHDLEARAGEYLERLQLGHKVQVRDGKLSTLALSQGQRKRLALLTAYLEDRPIYVFDEWAADQDLLFKEIFYREFLPELKQRGKTVVVISHDDRYYDVADKVIKLEDGRIVSSQPRAVERSKVVESLDCRPRNVG